MQRSPSHKVLVAISGLCIALGLAVQGWSQVRKASLTGLVIDGSGAVVPGGTVEATNNATRSTEKSTTTSAGYYLFPQMPMATYTVTVEMTGFKKETISKPGVNIRSR